MFLFTVITVKKLRTLLPVVFLLLASACGGDSDGEPHGNVDSGSNSTGGSANFASSEEFFDARVTSRMDFCRTCHIPGGVADTDEGRRFLLSSNHGDDYANTFAAWQVLGEGVEENLLIVENADPNEPHSGGKSWPAGSDAYNDMITLLRCWNSPASCVLSASGEVNDEFPLLAEVRGGNVWANFCEGKADDAVLPRDPRTLVAPGVNEGKAVAFNAFWSDCDNGVPKPKTCGEFREQAELGYLVGEGQGMVGSTTVFSGGSSSPSRVLPASMYNRLWQVWGLTSRPDNFDQLAAERYGSPQAPVSNPYPLEGEDPNSTGGGSGQLPLAFTQIREEDGRWTGQIGIKACVFCHDGQIGTEEDGPGLGTVYGGAGSLGDFTVAFYDFAKTGLLDPSNVDAITDFGPVAGLTVATNRGTGAIDFFQLGFILFNNGDYGQFNNDKILFSQAIGTIKSPPWWNMAWRPQKFHGAVLPTDSSRIDMAAYFDLNAAMQGSEAPLEWVDQHAGPFQVWAETLPSPQYPGEINTALAEQGAVLFHSKDLWADEEQTVARPEQGNGSCASCHGAYSPRYVNDPGYLDSPELAGIAAYNVPMSIVGTDPTYAEAMQSLKEDDGTMNDAIASNIFVYCGVGEMGETQTPKLLAPPLWGIWAAAPYFHNGSVPNIWAVLDPSSERPDIWRRVSTPARADQEGQVVMGYDTDLERAYDHAKLGWKYEELSCGEVGTLPFIDCAPAESAPYTEQLLNELYRNIAITWNLPRLDMLGMTNPQIEMRKIYNTNEYSQGNQGHAFTSVLTDAERRAIIEYLKTL